MDKIKIGVTGTGSLVGQAIIKSIKKSIFNEKIHIIGFDYFKDTVGSYWVKSNYLLPDFLKDDVKEVDWLERLIEIINKEDIKLIFIGIDFESRIFSAYKKAIESRTNCKVLVSSIDVIKTSDDKYLTYEFLKCNGLSYPQTLLPEDFGKADIKFPCILKPRFGTGSKDVFTVSSAQELNMRLPQINSPIIQELVGDADKEYSCGVIYLDNKVKESIVLKRYLKKGDTSVAFFSKNTPKIIYEYIGQITEKLKPFGVCNYQLRLDSIGIPRLFEINARHSGTTYIRSLFGFNEVEYILSYVLGFKTKEFRLKEGMVRRYYEEIFIDN